MQGQLILCAAFAALTLLAAPATAVEKNIEPAPETRAIIKVVHGMVTVASSQTTGPATPEQELRGTDRIAVAPEAWTVVRLRNGYYVRLDDEISIEVNQIALIDVDRKPEAEDEDQLRHLLSDQEFDADWQQAKGERLAGWFVRRTVGEAQPVQPAAEAAPGQQLVAQAADESKESPPQTKGAIRSFFDRLFGSNPKAPPAAPMPAAPMPAAPLQQPEPAATASNDEGATGRPPPPAKSAIAASARRQSVKSNAESKDEESPAAAGSSEVAAPERDAMPKPRSSKPHPLPEKKAQPAPAPSALPQKWVAALQRNTALKKCLQQALAAQELPLVQVELRIKVVDGKVDRLALGRGLQTPACVASLDLKRLKLARQQQLADGWYAIALTVK